MLQVLRSKLNQAKMDMQVIGGLPSGNWPVSFEKLNSKVEENYQL